jgi:hypothetical protein
MDRDRLFLHTLEDIEQRLSSRSEYEILGLAWLLRKLLLDGGALLDQVAQPRRYKPQFRVNDWTLQRFLEWRGVPPERFSAVTDKMILWSAEDNFDPEVAQVFGADPIVVSKDQLLAREVMVFQGHRITAKDLIDFEAHVQGAVHAGRPKGQKEPALKDLADQLRTGNLPQGLRTLRAIARVTLRSLEPLRQAVESSHSQGVPGSPP